jgi:hypothetical protein
LRIRADEHIAPKITKAVQSLILADGWELTHVREFHAARTADETWIPRFAAEGGQVFLSADRKMLSRPHQLAAIAEGNLIGILVAPMGGIEAEHSGCEHYLVVAQNREDDLSR